MGLIHLAAILVVNASWVVGTECSPAQLEFYEPRWNQDGRQVNTFSSPTQLAVRTKMAAR